LLQKPTLTVNEDARSGFSLCASVGRRGCRAVPDPVPDCADEVRSAYCGMMKRFSASQRPFSLSPQSTPSEARRFEYRAERSPRRDVEELEGPAERGGAPREPRVAHGTPAAPGGASRRAATPWCPAVHDTKLPGLCRLLARRPWASGCGAYLGLDCRLQGCGVWRSVEGNPGLGARIIAQLTACLKVGHSDANLGRVASVDGALT